ncbi:cupin [Candidatus Woesebacteria bacterium RIFCSPHIGHO2_01_FULL_38_9b]|uniref:Cupin n=1 Tax=Candidatus Woesebacteria bacterium RIFCSPHIGHO2_01_FULL_38_9b TaxID=1802493 RepID=A0A1F7Y0L7_9BACT|nr:MAG: cupin [Candidatus Woesebacteria bacterium RIFCSPHIGHO2_01_FULL_38_9b]
MKGFVTNIEKATETNTNFRKVLFTGKFCQLVVMSLKPGEAIGLEVHENVDQFFRIEKGKARFIIDGEEAEVGEDFAVVVPAGSKHNVINNSQTDNLMLYTIYSPPNHPEGTIHKTKKEAEANEHH